MAKVTLNKLGRIDRRTGRLGNVLDLEIADGQFLVLAGPPGSGKSNVLRMIAGLENISSGEISIGDKRVNDLTPKDRHVAMVFSNDSLYSQMTVRQNIAFGLQRRRFGAKEIQRRTEEATSVLSIGNLLEVTPGKLSFSQRQRVAIARAVVRQPKVLLFDHPLARVDEDSRAELGKQIIMLHERLRTTTIFATADDREAMTMAEMLVVLDESALQGVGTPRTLYEQPKNVFIAKFLGRPAMNFIPGELKLDRGAVRFYEANGGTIEIDLSKHERFGATASFAARPVVLGIRPQDIEIAEFARSNAQSLGANFRAIAEFVSPFGGGTDIHFQTGAHTGICRSATWLAQNEAGRRMEFVVNLERIHFFEEISGKSIV